MNAPRNTRSLTALFSGFDATLRQLVIDRPWAYWRTLRAKFENLALTNFTLGCSFAERGQWLDASFRFRFAIYLQPDYVQAHYNLGCCYLQLGKRDKAKTAFLAALKFKPDHEESRFMLSGLAPARIAASAVPKTMAAHMVTGFFTQLASDYDRVAAANQYDGPRLVAEACKPFLYKTQALQLVDLGCGTGLVARSWRGLCRDSMGIDMTPAMVHLAQAARAGEQPVYDRVITADINQLAAGTLGAGASDVVLCVDVAQFLGDLAPLCMAASHTLVDGGLLVLTIEPYAAPHGFGVNPDTGRFGHTPDYVKKLAASHGFEGKKDGRVALYNNQSAHLLVFAKRSRA